MQQGGFYFNYQFWTDVAKCKYSVTGVIYHYL